MRMHSRSTFQGEECSEVLMRILTYRKVKAT